VSKNQDEDNKKYLIYILVFLVVYTLVLLAVIYLTEIDEKLVFSFAQQFLELATLIGVVYALAQGSASLRQQEKTLSIQNKELVASREEWTKQSIAAEKMQEFTSMTMQVDNLYRAYLECRKSIDQIGKYRITFAIRIFNSHSKVLDGGFIPLKDTKLDLLQLHDSHYEYYDDDTKERGLYEILTSLNSKYNEDDLYLIKIDNKVERQLEAIKTLFHVITSMKVFINRLNEFEMGKHLSESLRYSDMPIYDLGDILGNLYFQESVKERNGYEKGKKVIV
jgi:uncharacterized membrane protein YciS (DUF1049 family)